jgi:hypothetical protein
VVKAWKVFKMWCLKRVDISWTDDVREEEVLQRVKVERSILQAMKRREAK